MTLLYASTFTKALNRLTAAEQKQVKITSFDLAQDESGNGLQLHKVEAAPGFWTARVNQDIRIVLHKAGGRTLLAYVDHHDDAYRWAERRKLVPHERTGAMQLVEVVERREERLILSDVARDDTGEAVWAERPFASLSDDALLDVGVPREWIEPVRETEIARVDDLFGSLPDEAAEALLDYATGGRLEDHIAFQANPDADPFTHPDAKRRFRMVEGLEELKAALDAPFAQWSVFLHPAQRAPVTRDWSGPARISGSAGTGKTIVALHRAVHLAGRDNAYVLLTTFSKPLAANLTEKVHLLTEATPHLRQRISTRAIDQAAHELYTRAFGQPNLATSGQIRAAIKSAVEAGLGAGHSTAFLFEEWEELVDAWGLHDVEAYTGVPRIGRRTRLGAKQRESAWEVFSHVRGRLAKRGIITVAQLYERLSCWIGEGGEFPFTHIVVDEAQDLSVAQARFLAALGRACDPEALFFTGDLGQRIFHLPFSWARLGLDVRGRAQVLKVCYRTSHQIRSAADQMLDTEIIDLDGNEESRRGTVSVFDGPAPTVELHESPDTEIEAVSKWLQDRLNEGIAERELAILVRSQQQLNRGRAAAKGSGAEVAVITMHDAKGLEFRAVVVMALDEDVLPDAERLATVGDVADIQAIQDTERHLLYVAATRARDRLMLTGVAPGTEFLDDIL
ncbi:UvrD-helicase domain-containing protein [Nitratireductor aquibiodomus]|uniref:3'-5' exonuclease n=1 Tax=Nitratireductor aquibiodomus TaxID=204799 RepID=UPI0019D34B39|nr:3'-5' exonuclease [Nitratireductor aquibiodomus]MBN7764079.1 UvrD-helicase domain-containing protein [Nitratireductor aquibiodomus]